LKKGALEIKEQVDLDNAGQGWLTVVSSIVLLVIGLILYLIYEKLNERITPQERKNVYNGSSFSSSSGPYGFKGKEI
jgi:hypothetical protein